MAGLFCSPLRVGQPPKQEPKSPVTEFEGTWHERVPPGTPDELRATIAFARGTVAITLNGETRRGTFTLDRGRGAAAIRFDVTTADGRRQVIEGLYLLERDTLSLSIGPEQPGANSYPLPDGSGIRIQAPANSGPGMGRAPVALTLAKAKK
jgi:hypothetical protein